MTQDFEGIAKAVKAHVFQMTLQINEIAGHIRSRPILGGALGASGLHMATVTCVRAGLDDVAYLVMAPETRLTVSVARTQADAMCFARDVAHAVGVPRLLQWNAELKADIERARDAQRRQLDQEHKAAKPKKVAGVSKRRRDIYEKAGGRCHYCSVALSLDGRWHIEHMLPRALGGDNHPDNLTAACVPCNSKKRDLTDVEFKQRLSAIQPTT